MKPGKIIVISLLLAVAVTSSAAEEKKKTAAAAKKEKISFTRYLETIRKKLPDIKKNQLQVDKSKNSLYATGAQEDFNLSSSFQYYFENSTSPMYPMDSTGAFSSNIGVNRKFIETGTQVSTGVEYAATSYKGSTLDTTTHEPAVYLNITQPLLNNAFGLVDRYAKNNAQMQLAIEKLKKKENDKSTLSYYKKLYFSWIDYRERLKILQKNIDRAAALYRQTARKHRAGLADNDDVQGALSSLFQYKELHRQSKVALDSIEKELSLYFDILQYEPDSREFEKYLNTALKEGYPRVTYTKTRSCEIYRLTQKNLNYNKKITRNQLLPQLNLLGGVTLKGGEEDLNDSFYKMNNVDYSIGLSVTYPLGNTEAKSKLKEAEIAISEINKEYESTENNYKKTLGTILVNVSGNKNIYDLKKKNLKALKSKLATEQKKYRQARIYLSYPVNTGIAIASEEINLLQLQRDMISYLIDYRDLTE